jgi:cobaltochelatase CobT
MNRNTLIKALPIVAAAYGRKFGVQVEVGGDSACANGQVVRIPEVGDDPLAKILAWGYLSHEAAHVRFTDFQAGNETFAKGGLALGILGVLEDIRIENALIREYPGARHTLDAVINWLVEQGKTRAPKEGDSPPQVLGNALLVMARHRYRRQVFLKEVATEAERVLRKTFPPSFVHRLLGLLTAVPGLASTQETADLAERIVALIHDEAVPDWDAPAQPQPEYVFDQPVQR